jgi:hypothetical protein
MVVTEQLRKILAELRFVGARLPDMESVYPLQAPVFHDAAAHDAIASLEAGTGGVLPPEYRQFLCLCGAIEAMDFFNGYCLFAPDFVQRQMQQGPNFSSVLIGGDSHLALPIGGNGGGDFFFLVPGHGIWRISHEILPSDGDPIDVSRPQWGVVNIAASFLSFLERIRVDWHHFVAVPDEPWDYACG